MTTGRGTRTSTSEGAPAAKGPKGPKGPKRPGSPASRESSGGSNGSEGERARTRTGATKRPAKAASGRSSGSSSRSKDDRGSSGASTGKRVRPTGRKAPRPSGSPSPSTPAPGVGAIPRMATASAATEGAAVDPTTEIVGFYGGPADAPSRDLTRDASRPAGEGSPAVAGPAPARSRERDDAPATRSRTSAPTRKGRRVKRVVRRIELWSVLKLSIVLYTCMYLAVLLTVVVLWGLAYSSGQVENIENFMGDVGLDNYRFYGDRMFKAVAAIGAVLVLAGTVLTVLWAALVNVISEMTGGIRVVVIEEEPTR